MSRPRDPQTGRWLPAKDESGPIRVTPCRACDQPFAQLVTGAVEIYCHRDDCVAARREAKLARKREARRAWRASNRDRDLAEKRAWRRTCRSCGEQMPRPEPTGLCGFCIEEQEMAA